MTKKSVGYVQLEWICPNCDTRNPGSQKVCSSCGMPQPEDVQFQQAAQEELIKDEAEIARAKAGPDIHCYYCGARNPAGAETCSQCGAPLAEGKARVRGQVVGAHRTGPAEKINCPACGTPNEANAPKCVQCGASLVQPEPAPAPPKAVPSQKGRRGLLGTVGIIALVLVIAACITFFVLSSRTEDVTGRVEAVSWTYNIAIEELAPVTYEEWRDEIPAEAIIGTCTQKVHHTQDNPAPNAQEVCGTPYTVDTGSGYGEVIQDCQYQVYEDWCEYSVDEWKEVDQATLSGNDLSPRWPDIRLGPGQREGKRTENYEIIFDTEQGRYTFHTGNANLFSQAQIGSRWLLKVNTFNSVTGIEPRR